MFPVFRELPLNFGQVVFAKGTPVAMAENFIPLSERKKVPAEETAGDA